MNDFQRSVINLLALILRNVSRHWDNPTKEEEDSFMVRAYQAPGPDATTDAGLPN